MLFDFSSHSFYICVEPVDMRSGANRLSQMIVTKMDLSPMEKALFLFTGRDRKSVKIVTWDGSGFWLLSKRLHRGTFAWPKDENEAKLMVSEDDVKGLLSGQDRWRRFPGLTGDIL